MIKIAGYEQNRLCLFGLMPLLLVILLTYSCGCTSTDIKGKNVPKAIESLPVKTSLPQSIENVKEEKNASSPKLQNDSKIQEMEVSLNTIVNNIQSQIENLVTELQNREKIAERRKREIESELYNSIQSVDQIKRERQRVNEFINKLQSPLTQDLPTPAVAASPTLVLGTVLFNGNTAIISPGSMAIIDKLALFLKQNPTRKVSIEGHTDSTGTKAFNRDLSKRRATSVLNALLAKDVKIQSIKKVIGYGDSRPVRATKELGDHKLNRRVELIISD